MRVSSWHRATLATLLAAALRQYAPAADEDEPAAAAPWLLKQLTEK